MASTQGKERETYLKGQSELVKHLGVIDPIQCVAAALIDVVVGGGRL